MHFTPTSSSWMNLVERFFRDLTEDVIRAGSFTSVPELVQAITGYLGDRQLHPKPYVWKKKGEDILAKIQRARAALAKRSAQSAVARGQGAVGNSIIWINKCFLHNSLAFS